LDPVSFDYITKRFPLPQHIHASASVPEHKPEGITMKDGSRAFRLAEPWNDAIDPCKPKGLQKPNVCHKCWLLREKTVNSFKKTAKTCSCYL